VGGGGGGGLIRDTALAWRLSVAVTVL